MTEISDIYEETKERASLTLGREELTGHLTMSALVATGANTKSQEPLVTVDLDKLTVTLGATAYQTYRMIIDMEMITIDAQTSSVAVRGNQQQSATLTMSNHLERPVIGGNAQTGRFFVGGDETPGELRVRDGSSRPTITAVGTRGELVVGGANTTGHIELKQQATTRATLNAVGGLSLLSSPGETVITLEVEEPEVATDPKIARGVIGGPGARGILDIRDSGGTTRIQMTGQDGDIRFAGADLAEEFTVADQALADAAPGMVMVLDDDGTILPCSRACDPRVVGVIAGAGEYRPAMILDRKGGPGRHPIAMIGKVFCRVSAENVPIRIGDLLTTSATPGHAQALADRSETRGTIIGKALGKLDAGTGLIPVLVNLH